ncbi:MAG: serine/threonine-protein kinase [Thermodesulfobacteriota bacterium]
MDKSPKYRILEKIGEGGMGVVYKAHDARLNREVAIKVLRIDPSRQLPAQKVREIKARFYKEAQAAARLNHPNIVAIHQVGQSAGRPYIVMEYLRGRNLLERMEEPLPIKEVLRIALQICDALDYAHSQGVVHRDVKPDNIVIMEDGRVKIADFGIARMEDAEVALTRAGVLMGSPAYCAPEQLRDFSKVDGRADIFSLGVILYQCLTGRLPFDGSATPQVITRILTQEPKPPRLINPEIPPSLESLVLRALAKDPEERIPSAKEFRAGLERALRALEGATAEELRTTVTMERIKPKRRPLPLAVTGGLLLALLVYGAMAYQAEVGILEQSVSLRGNHMARMLEVGAAEDSFSDRMELLQGYLEAMGRDSDIVFLEVTRDQRSLARFADQQRMVQQGDIHVRGFPMRTVGGAQAMLLVGFSKTAYNDRIRRLRTLVLAGGGFLGAVLGLQLFLARRKTPREEF